MRLAIFSFAAGLALLSVCVCRADEPAGKPGYAEEVRASQPAHAPAARVRRFGPGTYNKQAAIGAYGRAVYPKYYWGFHADQFQNLGIPHGDIGTLGNGLQRTPW